MNGLMKSTYTFESLKKNIFKLLGEYSLNGSELSSVNGFLADVEKRYIACLNICLRRVILSLPLLVKSADLQFFGGKAVLLGVDMDRNTVMHSLEEAIDAKYLRTLDIVAPTYIENHKEKTFTLEKFPPGHRIS